MASIIERNIRPSWSPEHRQDLASLSLRWSVRALVGTVWASSAIFSLYILALFLGAIAIGTPDDWNSSLPGLHVSGSTASNAGIGLHFGLGAILLLLGPIQFIGAVRDRWPGFHRAIGRVYAASALLTGLGGLSFILLRGTIGGPVMSLGFGLYGALMVIASLQTVRHAMARRRELHRSWAIRLYALAIGSWIYRMDYGFWMLFAGRLWRTKTFDGPFDVVMIFWFYLPNLLVAEAFIRARRSNAPAAGRAAAALLLGGGTAFLMLATYSFTAKLWGPAILSRMAG